MKVLLFETCFLKLSVDFDCTRLCFILDSISFRTFTYTMLLGPIVILTTCSPFLFYFCYDVISYILNFELYFVFLFFTIDWFLFFRKLKRQLLVISI